MLANIALLILMSIKVVGDAPNGSRKSKSPAPFRPVRQKSHENALTSSMTTGASLTMCENKYLIIYKSWPGQATLHSGRTGILAGIQSIPGPEYKYINYGNIFCHPAVRCESSTLQPDCETMWSKCVKGNIVVRNYRCEKIGKSRCFHWNRIHNQNMLDFP